MKLLETQRQSASFFVMVLEHENGQKEKWLYERVERRSGVDFIQVGKETA